MEKTHTIRYINTLQTSESELVSALAELVGYNSAQQTVKKWYESYNEMLIDMETAEVFMFKRRIAGYWESVPSGLENFR